MVERGGGRLKLIPVAERKKSTIQPYSRSTSANMSERSTPTNTRYTFSRSKTNFGGKHQMIVHKRTYGIGDVHTNTIESAFSLFKQGLYGTFHNVSKKHLARYCDEFSYRFNHRKEQEQMFGQTSKQVLNGKPLTYAELTSEKAES